jgi:hypothetical protein
VLYNKSLDTFKLASKLHLVRFSPKKKKPAAKKSKGGMLSSMSQPLMTQPGGSRVRKRQISRDSASSQPVSYVAICTRRRKIGEK